MTDAGLIKGKTHASLQKGIQILELLAERSPQGVTEMAGALGLELSGMSRLLKSLADVGYVVPGPRRGQYQSSPKVLGLARGYETRDALVREAAPLLRALALKTRATAHLAVAVRRQAIVVAKEPSPERIQVVTSAGLPIVAHASALGKVLLAALPERELEEFLKAPLPRFTEHTITDPRKLRRELERIREKGSAFESEEEHRGVGCIGVPVLDAGGRWIAAISAAGPVHGTPFRLDQAHLKMVLQTALELSRRV
jgi:IclR family acetate operon transcriptional repressor